jgi:hypothetical protein
MGLCRGGTLYQVPTFEVSKLSKLERFVNYLVSIL